MACFMLIVVNVMGIRRLVPNWRNRWGLVYGLSLSSKASLEHVGVLPERCN